jgi:hypothetical protein
MVNMGIVLVILVVLLLCLGFFIIARKGRALRCQHPIPPPAKQGRLHWFENGVEKTTQIISPFYLGKDPENNIVLPLAQVKFEACIFFHNERFAIQSLEGAGEILVNGQEMIAGYLFDGDQLVVGKNEFMFRCS